MDGVFDLLNTAGRAALQEQFDKTPLIIDAEGVWRCRLDVYQANDEELPGIAVIHPEMSAMSLWDRIGVERSPNMDKVLSWLRELPSRAEIPTTDRRRVAAILGRVPRVALDATRHWLSRAGTWVPWQELHYFIVSRTGDGAGDGMLFPQIRRQIADLSMLAPELAESLKSHLFPLAQVLMQEPEMMDVQSCPCPDWIQALAVGFLRAHPTDETDAQVPENAELADQLQAIDLYFSTFQIARSLRITPFLKGVPAGTPVTTRALWQDRKIIVVGAEPSYHRSLIEQLSHIFVLRGFKQAVSDCVGRPASWIEGYFEENFSLRSRAEAERELGLTTMKETAAAGPTVGNITEPLTGGFVDYPPKDHLLQETDESDATLPYDEDQSCGGQAEQGHDDGLHDYTDLVNKFDTEPVVHSTPSLRRSAQHQSPLTTYLTQQGFIYDETRRLYLRSSDGATVRREGGSDFHIQYDSDGEEQAQYWENSASIAEGVLVPADIWLYLEQRPAYFSLVMFGLDGKPCVFTGAVLLRWKEQQHLTVSAASYRIKFADRWIASLL